MSRILLQNEGRLFVATWPEQPTVEEIQNFFDRMDRHYEERLPLALVLDARNTNKASADVREEAVRRMKERDELMRQYLRAQATVLTSTLVRGALASMHFLSPPSYPVKTFSDLTAAKEWASELLNRRV